MNKAMEAMGGTIVRRFRLYERVLDDGDSVEPVNTIH